MRLIDAGEHGCGSGAGARGSWSSYSPDAPMSLRASLVLEQSSVNRLVADRLEALSRASWAARADARRGTTPT